VARRIEYSRAALRTLQRIDRATGERIVLKIEQLADRPESLASNVRALKGPGGLKRLRVGDWRVIFTETLVVVGVERIAPRGSAYD
jgi:mRNA interferase RelE/StbE